MIAVAVTSVVLAALALRSVASARPVIDKQVPSSDLQNLAAYLAPLPDSTSLAESGFGGMVWDRDPFGVTSVAPSARVQRQGRGTSSRPRAGGGRWVVSSILFEDSKRSAIVNNAWVTVGDRLDGGARLTAIERKHVVVTDANGTRHVVPIQGGES